MARFIRSGTVRTLCGLAAGGSVIAAWTFSNSQVLGSAESDGDSNTRFSLPLQKVLASYTTNFEPSVKWDANWDRRDPASMIKPTKNGKEDDYKNELKKATPTACRHLFLIRHGQYDLNGKGDQNRVLTKLGERQAEITGKRLKELNFEYDVMINSTMTRATQTSNIIAKQLPEVPRKSCDMLREGAPYPPEPPTGDWKPEAYVEFVDNGRIEAAFRKYFHRASPRQHKDSYEIFVLHGNFFGDGARIEAAFRKYIHRASLDQTKDSHEVMVFHANVIRYFVCRALQIPPEAWKRFTVYDASITWIRILPWGHVDVYTFGQVSHLPSNMITR